MNQNVLNVHDVRTAGVSGDTESIHHREIKLESAVGCELNCGSRAPVTSLEALVVRSWLNHDGEKLVLDLRDVRYSTSEGTRQRDEALAYVTLLPATPKLQPE